MKPIKVFIVDDDPDFSDGMALTLEIEGYEVSRASSGDEAIQRFREEDFDITFMDVRMPGKNGVESFLEIRKDRPHAKVVMMTAYSVESLLKQAVDGGAIGVIHKPFGEQELLKYLAEAKPAGMILLVDDDPDFAEGVEASLAGAGYSVVVANDGREAVDRALSEDFDVLILHVRLPVMTGLEVYTELKRQGRALPTVIVTGYAEEEAQSIGALQGLSAKICMVKPFGSEELLNVVGSLIQEPARGAE